jgi:CheY-like chemotaxis protein
MVRINFNRLRFLVVDDNAHMRRILRALVNSFGSREVYEAEDGAAGLEAFIHYLPDIVITDWVMPIFNGLEFTQMIRQPGANPNPFVPIIMLTGHSEKHRVVGARDAGITEFLAKPISATGLYQRILNLMAYPRPFIKTKSYFGPDRRRTVNPNYVGPERRRGGKADQAALAQLANEFAGWMQTECERLEAARQEVKRSGFTKQTHDVLFRVTHDIKGEAATFGYPAIGGVANSLCRLLEHTPDISRIPLALVEQHVDAIRAVVREQAHGDLAAVAEELTRRLRQVTDEFLRAENRSRPDYLKNILTPLAP